MIVNPGIEIILTISTKMPHEPYIKYIYKNIENIEALIPVLKIKLSYRNINFENIEPPNHIEPTSLKFHQTTTISHCSSCLGC